MTLRKLWGFSGEIKKIWSGGLILLILLMPVTVKTAPIPHAFMDDPARCSSCHDRTSVKTGGGIVKDNVSPCTGCHVKADRMSHPVGIKLQGGSSSDLPLDPAGTITCLTCHDPHSDPSSPAPFVNRGMVARLGKIISSAGYPTYFLRMPNTEGQLCLSCHEKDGIEHGHLETPADFEKDYTGSKACERCHEGIYREWKRTAHARTLQDPKENPQALKALFIGNESFKPEEIENVVGTRWMQRYVLNREGELKIARDVWSLGESVWLKSSEKEQSWRDFCAGCHVTGYNPYENTFVEKGVGCEMCHGPGGNHVRSGQNGNIVNPARIEGSLARSICASCHTSGHDRTGRFRYPAGYIPGEKLDLYFRGLVPHTGQGEDTFKDDGTLDDRLRSLDFWFERVFKPIMIVNRECSSLNVISTLDDTAADGDLTLSQYCLTCHDELPSGPKHKHGSGYDVDCYSCHMPIADKTGEPSIHDHKFFLDK